MFGSKKTERPKRDHSGKSLGQVNTGVNCFIYTLFYLHYLLSVICLIINIFEELFPYLF